MDCSISCTICGTPIVGDRSWPKWKWMRQFRAVYTKDGRNERWDPDVPARLSGVGQRRDYADLVPVSHSGGSRRSRGTTVNIELMITHLLGPGLAVPGLQPVARGYALRDSCWRVLVMVSPGGRVDIQRLLDVFRSFPIKSGIMNFGHNYGGIAEHSKIFDSGLVAAGKELLLDRISTLKYPTCDPLDIPALRGFLKKWGSAYNVGGDASTIRPYHGPVKADVFSEIPEETLSLIFEHLPSPDVARLRKSSRICATATLRESFWRSRFQPGREFDYILGPDVCPTGVAGRWKSLYLFVRAVQDVPDVANRRRVWGLARSLKRLVAVSSAASLHGDEVASVDRRHWITASRSLWSLDSAFITGSRALWTRTLNVPGRARIFASIVEVCEMGYISGLRLEYESGGGIESLRLGYIHSEVLVCETAMAITGFLLAHSERGIRGISVLSDTGVPSPWVGDHENIPKRRLALDPVGSIGRTIRCLKGGFDAFKLISLSISSGDHQRDDGTPTPSLCDSVIWYPDIPDPHYSIIGIGLTGRDDNHPQRPVTLAIFGGSNGDRLSKVRGLSIRLGLARSRGNILGLTFSFTDGSEKVGLEVDTEKSMKPRSAGVDDSASGNDGSDQDDSEDETDYDGEEEDEDGYNLYEDETDFDGDEEDDEDEEVLTFEVDSQNGERIVGIDVLRRTSARFAPVMDSIKIHTNKGRAAEFPPHTAHAPRSDVSFSVESLRPEKGIVVGFCSRVSSLRGLTDVGIVVRNNLC